jgi:hypothetical protein
VGNLRALAEALESNPALLRLNDLEAVDLRRFRDKLPATYFIRLFAEFETAVREYWIKGLGKDSQIRFRDMIESVASRQPIDDDWVKAVQAARKYRNSLIHEEDAESIPMALADARRSFGRYLGRLPDDW